ncbi:hypothetical protein D6745_05605 [Candidatus Woesearchaeota archaeon]|nr:MAG: hypothetical protein D6745_05605 [Candidatus Woesearchaeota archaeon]
MERKPRLFFEEGTAPRKKASSKKTKRYAPAKKVAKKTQKKTKGKPSKKKALSKKTTHQIGVKSGKVQIKGAFDMGAVKKAIEQKLQKRELQESFSDEGEFFIGEKRVATGIPGLDRVMEGGFRINTSNLIVGGAGCGKSIFCMQFLVNGIDKYNENGIYISFEESEDKILKDFEKFPWHLKEKIKSKKLVILSYTPEQVAKVLSVGGGTIRDTIESIGAKRIVIDSLTAFTLLHENELTKRKELLKLFESIYKWNVTALLTAEHEPDPDRHESNVLEFEVDGVILLYNVRKGDIRERSLEVFKMRGTKHSAKIYPMKITDNGIIIYPDETVF